MVDDGPGLRVETAPEAEGLVEDHGLRGCRAPIEHLRVEFKTTQSLAPQVSLRHKRSSRHTSPRNAERTHSSRVPNTDSTASIPGA